MSKTNNIFPSISHMCPCHTSSQFISYTLSPRSVSITYASLASATIVSPCIPSCLKQAVLRRNTFMKSAQYTYRAFFYRDGSIVGIVDECTALTYYDVDTYKQVKVCMLDDHRWACLSNFQPVLVLWNVASTRPILYHHSANHRTTLSTSYVVFFRSHPLVFHKSQIWSIRTGHRPKFQLDIQKVWKPSFVSTQ